MMTGEQYIESMRKLKLNIYLFGEKIESAVDNPILRPSMNSVKATYDLAHDPEYEDLMTTTSRYSGEKINRFTHLHSSPEDLVKKVKMQRMLGQRQVLVSNVVSEWMRLTPCLARRMKSTSSRNEVFRKL